MQEKKKGLQHVHSIPTIDSKGSNHKFKKAITPPNTKWNHHYHVIKSHGKIIMQHLQV